MSLNGKRKGAEGERDFARALGAVGVSGHRGYQFKGGPDSPDVVSELENIHWEIKRVERLNLWAALEQAKKDCGDKIPVVAFRRNKGKWYLCFELENVEGFVNEWKE